MKRFMILAMAALLALTFSAADCMASSARVDNSGVVWNNTGQRLGKIENDGTVFNATGQRVGKINNDGSVFNATGQRIGKVDNDGTTWNSTGQRIGKAGQGMRAGALFFFFK